MKKLLFTLCAAALSTVVVNGQTRFSLYEEFSGEMCAPCAAANPGLWTLISANPSKVLLIKYQGPYAGAGPIYNEYKTVHDARALYYSNSSGPSGTMDGGALAHPSSLTQSAINTASAVATPFNVTVTHAWDVAGDSLTANISVNTPAAFTSAGANFKIRVALIEHLEYCAAPGSNGEKEFHNVVREMYPNAAGTAMQNTWALNETHNYTIRGAVPSRVDKTNDRAVIVVWIQDDATKQIFQVAQSAKVALPADGSTKDCYVPVLACATASATVPSTVTLTNKGANALTSATIFYKVDNGSFSSTTWTGNLASGGSTSVSIPPFTLTAGAHVIMDSVGVVNGAADINSANSVTKVNVSVQDANPAVLPVTTDFENNGSAPAKWLMYDNNGNGSNWMLPSNTGYNSSTYALLHYNYNFPAGESNTAILPGTMAAQGAYALDFYLAYAQYQNENDKLEVVYSTDCGTTWNTVWSDMGSSLATASATTANFIPKTGDWKLKSIDVSSIPAGALIAFRATSDYGNNIFIDDVNLHSSTTTGIRNVVAAAQEIKLYPNPAQEAATLQFSLAHAGSVQVNLLDATGRTISVIADANMKAGAQSFKVNTSSLAPGLYQVVIRSEEGLSTQRLSVVK